MSAHQPAHDYYEILQVHPKATLAVIKKAYRTLLLELGNHPDQGGSAEQASLITEAYRVLSDATRRAEYDKRYFAPIEAASAPKPAADAPPAPVTSLVVLCPRCRTKNRVKSQELLSVAKCSRCGQALSRLPGPFADMREHMLGALQPLMRRLGRPMPKTFMLVVPAALLIASAAAGLWALSDSVAFMGDPLERTETLKQEGRLDQAAILLQKALEREPTNARLHEKLGDVYHKQLLYEEAIAEYQRAIELNPQNSYLYTLKGNTYMQLGQLPQAELTYRQALKIDPQQAPALVALGNLLAKKQRFVEAARLYQEALEQNASADVLYNLGMVYQWDGQPKAAADTFTQALIHDPNHRSSMVSLASLYYEQGQYDQAAAQLIKASYLKHSDLDLHLRLADIYERTGQTQAAIREWQVCLDQGKDKPAVLERAKKALERLGVTG